MQLGFWRIIPLIWRLFLIEPLKLVRYSFRKAKPSLYCKFFHNRNGLLLNNGRFATELSGVQK